MINIEQYADELMDLFKELLAIQIQRLAIAQATIKSLQKEVEELKKQVFND